MVLSSFDFIKKVTNKSQSSGHYYDIRGILTLVGTWRPIFTAENFQRSERESELLTMHFDGTMTAEDQPEWERLKDKKFYIPKGALQKPRDSWSDADYKNYFEVQEPQL